MFYLFFMTFFASERKEAHENYPLQFSQPANPPILIIVRLIFQSRSYNFLTPNFPLTKKRS